MSLKKKNRLTPVKLKDLIAGQTYLYMIVCLDGQMILDKKVFYGRPQKYRDYLHTIAGGSFLRSSWMIQTRHQRAKNPERDQLTNFDFASSMGMSQDGRYSDNYHRIFRYTMRNEQLLKKLAERQAFVEYLSLIGVKDVAEALARKARGAETMEELNYMDDHFDDFDDDDFGETHDLDAELEADENDWP